MWITSNVLMKIHVSSSILLHYTGMYTVFYFCNAASLGLFQLKISNSHVHVIDLLAQMQAVAEQAVSWGNSIFCFYTSS